MKHSSWIKERKRMLQVTKVDRNGNESTIFLEGEIDERANMVEIFNRMGKNVRLNLKLVTRINSQGVKHWIQFFRNAAETGVKLKYVECSPPITHFLPMFIRLGAGNEVESVYAPFTCLKCNQYSEHLIKTVDFSAVKPQITGRKCEACTGELEMAELSQDYFAFLCV